ncbi:MAG: hypothetical protein H7A41_02610 [Chlamydiales bacterium]|nr:hypothetical protein [Chlamydiales bacterium]
MESASHTLDQRRFSVDGGMDPNFLNGITVLHVEDKELHSFTAKKAVEGNQLIYSSSSEESSSIIEGYFKAHLGKVGGKVSLYQAISKDLIELRITFLS